MAREASSRAETLRWRDGRLEMIDQRVLSGVFVYKTQDPYAPMPFTISITESGVVQARLTRHKGSETQLPHYLFCR